MLWLMCQISKCLVLAWWSYLTGQDTGTLCQEPWVQFSVTASLFSFACFVCLFVCLFAFVCIEHIYWDRCLFFARTGVRMIETFSTKNHRKKNKWPPHRLVWRQLTHTQSWLWTDTHIVHTVLWEFPHQQLCHTTHHPGWHPTQALPRIVRLPLLSISLFLLRKLQASYWLRKL